ncbi:MAG: hypothetical protein ACUVQ2_08595 [Dissulfurimicrobium sp.]
MEVVDKLKYRRTIGPGHTWVGARGNFDGTDEGKLFVSFSIDQKIYRKIHVGGKLYSIQSRAANSGNGYM